MNKKIMFDYNKLKGRMREKKYTQKNGADDLKISKTTFNLKINNNGYFIQDEIFILACKLDIKDEEITEYFFTLLV